MTMYIYLGDRFTDASLRNQPCSAVPQANGKCVRGRNGNMLVEFQSGKQVVIARLLRKMKNHMSYKILRSQAGFWIHNEQGILVKKTSEGMTTQANIFVPDIAKISIPVLSLWQPWASAYCTPHLLYPNRAVKEYETRHWEAKVRGRILVHATQKVVAEKDFMSHDMVVNSALKKDIEYIETKKSAIAPFGAIIGTVIIMDVITSEKFIKDGPLLSKTAIAEWGWGNWGPGRFGFRSAMPVLFDEPIPMKGKQTIFWKLPLTELPEQYHQHFLT